MYVPLQVHIYIYTYVHILTRPFGGVGMGILDTAKVSPPEAALAEARERNAAVRRRVGTMTWLR